MSERDDFLAWVESALYEAELALHNGDAAARNTPSASVDGQPRSYTLRATQMYRREGGEWRVARRHADTVTD